MKKKLDLGKWGEKLARTYLLHRGYTILAENYHSRYGEIDIIARLRQEIVFIEVKTRKNNRFCQPLEAVNYSKQQKLILTAQHYITLNYSEHFNYRFDVIDIIFNRGENYEINHLKGAFEL